jgi:glyoxalase family protein
MALQGLHHVTAVTGDAPAATDFYARVLGLRLVKKTVNFDQPDVYHLYFGDEAGAPGSIITFFEFPGVALGRAGEGMVHTIQWRVPGAPALAFWEDRLRAEGVAVKQCTETAVRFCDHEGLRHELLAGDVSDAPLVARSDDVPAEHALQGLHGVRAYARRPDACGAVLEALGFERRDGDAAWRLTGDRRQAELRYDQAPPEAGHQGAGTVHHVAWAAADDAELEAAGRDAAGAGVHPTRVIDRQYFRSVYFREPGGVLFELASSDIGFTLDEPADALGQELRLPPQFESQRAELERRLAPLPNPRAKTPS